MSSDTSSYIEPFLEKRQNCALLPTDSSKRSAGTDPKLACAVANGIEAMNDAINNPLYYDLLLPQTTTCPNFPSFAPPILTALHQIQAATQDLVQWSTNKISLYQQECTIVVVLALAYFVWTEANGIITDVLIPNSWFGATATAQPSAISSTASCPRETFSGTPVVGPGRRFNWPCIR